MRSAMFFAAVWCAACANGSGAGGSATSAADALADLAADAAAAADAPADTPAGKDGATDSAPDTAADASADAKPDAGTDAALDSAPDSAPDAAPDSAPDAATDSAADSAPDSAPDAVADAVKDAVADATAKDAVAEIAADAAKEIALPGPEECSAEQDCKNAKMCIAPGEFIGCGMCFKPEDTCASDKDCAPPATICKPAKCACGGESTCQPGCKVAADCPEGFFCAPTGQCVEDVCLVTDPPGADKNCKPNFVCQNPANPHCYRKKCATSAECQGFCVKGLCYSGAGTCSYPPP